MKLQSKHSEIIRQLGSPMQPPSAAQTRLIRQLMTAGLIDRVARKLSERRLTREKQTEDVDEFKAKCFTGTDKAHMIIMEKALEMSLTSINSALQLAQHLVVFVESPCLSPDMLPDIEYLKYKAEDFVDAVTAR
jgi:hypothetical protein